MILKVRNAATPTCRGCVSPSVCVTQAINGRCAGAATRLTGHLWGLGVGGLRGPVPKLWMSEGREEASICGVVFSGILWVRNYDRLRCPSWALRFHPLTSFFINVLEGGGVRWILAGGVVAQTFSEFLN